MLIITNLKGQSEPVADYKSLEVNEEVNGDFSLSCTFINSINNQHAWELIAEESIIEYEGHEYRIKQKKGELFQKEVYAPHIYFDLIEHQVYGRKSETITPHAAFKFILDGTGWTHEIIDSIPAQAIYDFGEDNAIALIKRACKAFECEIKIEPGMHIKVFKEIGKDDDFQFRYKHNIKTIKEVVDTTKLNTVIKGFGANGLVVTYTSPNISVFGERHAQPVRDDRYTIAKSMHDRLAKELIDYPEVSIELDAILINRAELGDKVWLIHEPLGIEFQTRIVATKKYPKLPSKNTVTLGNIRQTTISDFVTETREEITESENRTRSKFEQTNDRITLEVESVNESIATIELKADNIQLGVTELNGRMGNAESRINIQAGQIEQRVTYYDYNGQTITSKITQDPYSISLLAQNLNLQGLVTFTNLNSPGQAVIDGGNIYGQKFVVGNGTGSTLTMTSIAGSHSFHSNDAYGFRMSSNGSVSIHSGAGYPIFLRGFTRLENSNLSIENSIGTPLLATNLGMMSVSVSGTLNANTLQQGGYPVATQMWVINLLDGLVTTTQLNNALRQKESEIVAWANNKFVAK